MSTSMTGKYIYAIIDQSTEQNYGPIGLNGGDVYTLSHGSFAAVVSDLVDKRIRPERKNLAAHNAVVKRLMEDSTILPAAFGTLASNAKAVRDILKKNSDTLIEELEQVRGKVEMGLRVTLDVANIFEYIVNSSSELADLRDQVMGKPHGPSQMDQIELGRLFDRSLTDERERHTEAVLKVLGPLCVDIKENPTHDKDVMRLACLVARDSQKKFEDGVFDAAKLFDNNFGFDFNGPWAPHNFVNVNLEP